MRWDHQAPLLPTPTAGINPNHAAALHCPSGQSQEEELRPVPRRTPVFPLAYIFAYFFACALGVLSNCLTGLLQKKKI